MRRKSTQGQSRSVSSYSRLGSSGGRRSSWPPRWTLECTDTGERVTLEVRGGEVRFDTVPAAERVPLTERQMVQLVFGSHPSCEPLALPAKGAELLDRVFPFYFPIWELDRS